MRLAKFLSISIFITAFSLLYAYQETEIFRLAYVGQKRLVTFEDLLDKNHILRYNIDSNASLVRIGNKISRYTDFQMPDTYQLVRLTPSKPVLSLVEQGRRQQTLLSRIFGIKRQAEAKTVNP